MYKNPVIQRLRNPVYETHQVAAFVLRLDEFHPFISGNKYFKLKYYLQYANVCRKKGVVSFGGAFSNHLVAMAHACQEYNLKAIGIIRGDEAMDNPSLREMRACGMQLQFVSRNDYRNKDELVKQFTRPDYLVIPEGGSGPEGVRGAAEILSYTDFTHSHILCSVGTGTTMAGIINASKIPQQVIGISALKLPDVENNALLQYIGNSTTQSNYKLINDYHFGGYARKTPELLNYMKAFYEVEQIPSDFVYTGKLFFASEDLTRKGHFPAGSRLLIIHSGGLQGNRGAFIKHAL